MHIKDGHKKLRKSKEKEKTMRRTRSMLAVLGIVCALSGITGRSWSQSAALPGVYLFLRTLFSCDFLFLPACSSLPLF